MSMSVSIGSNPQDIENLILAKDIAKFVSSLMKAEDHSVIFADANYTQQQINDFRSWIDDILFIIHNSGTLYESSEDTYFEQSLTQGN